MKIRLKKSVAWVGLLVIYGWLGVASAGTLFVGADVEEFGNHLPFPPDRLGKVTTNGADFVSQVIIPLGNLPSGAPILLNGMADGGGFLFAGTPLMNTLHRLDYDGNLISSINAPGIPSGGCCNEEMLYAANGKFYHAHFSDVIREIDPVLGTELDVFPQPDTVGMALVGSDIWISHWAAREVGIWDPVANSFTYKFSTPTNAGGLAYDPDNGIMWVGRQGGMVEPYSLAGVLLGHGFQPFGDIPDTIDGLVFRGEAKVPEPTIALLMIPALGAGVLAPMMKRFARKNTA